MCNALVSLRNTLNNMSRDDVSKRISCHPLFARLTKPGAAARFARDMVVSHQRLTNWKRRGVPSAMLPEITATLGMTVEEYLHEAGREPLMARQTTSFYLTDDERELVELYRAATGRWKVAIRHMAALRGDTRQDEAADSMNYVLAKIAADPAPNHAVEAAYGIPPGRSRKP